MKNIYTYILVITRYIIELKLGAGLIEVDRLSNFVMYWP